MTLKVPEPVEDWLVVLRGDGVVDAVEGGAPVTWLERELATLASAPSHLRHAAEELVGAAQGTSVRRAKVWTVVRDKEVSVELLLVEALPVRRAYTSVRDVAMRTLDLFASQAKSSAVALTVEVGDEVPAAFVMDGEKVAWALSTLVGNALRYARREVRVRVHGREEGGVPAIVLDVVDDGPGIPEKAARWLFERDPETGKSVGLALLMVKDIVAAHRGSVGVTTLLGGGTTFTMALPRQPATPVRVLIPS